VFWGLLWGERLGILGMDDVIMIRSLDRNQSHKKCKSNIQNVMRNELTDFQALYLGALLHDIGKFQQRSEQQNQYTKHPILSSVFVRQLFQDDRINAIAAFHHTKDFRQSDLPQKISRLVRIVGEADSLASRERESKKGHIASTNLQNIFAHLFDFNKNATPSYQPICPLNIKDYKFVNPDPAPRYEKEQWVRFQEESNQIIRQIQEHQWGDALLMLYKKYLWCIPSAYYQSVPDISLYEHSRLTAAIATCLYKSVTFKQNDKLISDPDYAHYFLLCGDLTGIQSYIYNIGHKRAAKALKGRSFALQHLTEVLARELLQAFDLPLANLIYASGGKFYVLLPNTTDLEAELKNFQTNIDLKFLDESTFQGEIGLIMAGIPLCGKDFRDIANKWNVVQQQLERKKKKRYASQFTTLFSPFGPSGAVEECVATKKDLCAKEDVPQYLENKLIFEINMDEEDEAQRYQSAEQYYSAQLGEALKQTSTSKPLIRTYDVTDQSHSAPIPIGNIVSVSISKSSPQDRYEGLRFGQILNDDDFLSHSNKNFISWKFYGGNWQTDEFDNLISMVGTGIERLGVLRMDVDNLGNTFRDGFGTKATFSRITQLSTMLDFFFCGYINLLKDQYWHPLGGILSTKPNGTKVYTSNEHSRFVEKRKTFFENPDENLKPEDRRDNRTVYPLKDLMQIVYAGGDDLFIVGHWAVLPDVAIWIRDEFNRFTGNHPQLTISGGISIFSQKYPIYKAAKAAGEAESAAKQQRKMRNGNETKKNAISFLDTVMSWEDFKEVRSNVHMFYKISPQKDIPDEESPLPPELSQIRLELAIKRGIFQRLHLIYDEYVANDEKRWASWCWRAFYNLSRTIEQEKDDVKKRIIRFRDDLVLETPKTEQDMIKLLYPIARWAELLTRKKEN